MIHMIFIWHNGKLSEGLLYGRFASGPCRQPIFSYSVSGAMSAPFGQEIVPPSILACLKNDLSRIGSKTGPLPM
jgi:hypothetical protein